MAAMPDKSYLKITCWVVGIGAVFVALGYATFDEWAKLVAVMFGAM